MSRSLSLWLIISRKHRTQVLSTEMTMKLTKFREKVSQSIPPNISRAMMVIANQIKEESQAHFRCFVKFVGGTEQGFRRCFAGVTSRGLYYICNACYMITGCLSFLFEQQNYIFIAFFLINYNEFTRRCNFISRKYNSL